MKNKMSVLPIILSTLLLTLSFASCDTAEQNPADTSADTTAATAAATEAATLADTQAETVAETAAPAETQASTMAETESETLSEPPDGSFATAGYTVSRVGDTYYLNFIGGNELTEQESIMGSMSGDISFTSLAEMRDKIKNDTLTESNRAVVKRFFDKDENGIKMFNINQMYQPVYPEGFTCADIVVWSGESYSVYVHELSNMDFGGYLSVLSSEDYEWNVDRYITNFFSHVLYESILSQEADTWNGLPCETWVFETTAVRMRRTVVEIPMEQENEFMYIAIEYRLERFNDNQNLTISDTVPSRVHVIGQTNGQGYALTLFDFSTAPTLEFLTSFGITPYVEPDAEITPVPAETAAVS